MLQSKPIKNQGYMIKKTFTLALFLNIFLNITAQDEIRKVVEIETTMGNIKIELYNETPNHRDNFIKLVSNNYYDGILFHRVIKDFMIQAGDPNSRTASQGVELGDGDEPYKLDAEFLYPQLFHKKGALAAAREPDAVNPEKKSSSTQFYIVIGQIFNDAMLDRVQNRLNQTTNGMIKLTDSIRQVYKTIGGTPHLDGQYTVFGEVVEGIDIVEKIQMVTTDEHDRPLVDVRILSMSLLN